MNFVYTYLVYSTRITRECSLSCLYIYMYIHVCENGGRNNSVSGMHDRTDRRACGKSQHTHIDGHAKLSVLSNLSLLFSRALHSDVLLPAHLSQRKPATCLCIFVYPVWLVRLSVCVHPHPFRKEYLSLYMCV